MASEHLYRLICNGSSANGILPADIFGGGGGEVRPVKLAVQSKTSMLWGVQHLQPQLPSPLYFFLKSSPTLVCPLLYLLRLSKQYIITGVFTASILPPSWQKRNGNSNIYSCRYVSPPTYPSPAPDALQVPDWSPRVIIFNNKQATHQAADNLNAFIWTGRNGPA